MNPEDKIILLGELVDTQCELSHGIEESPSNHPAVDYITIPVGQRHSEDRSKDSELVIPVCTECIEALEGNDWTLLYCLNCNESAWVHRDSSKLKYRNLNTNKHYHILALIGCPKCSDNLEGLCFID